MGNVIEITEFYSHTRFFNKMLSKTTIQYSSNNLPTEYSKTNYIEGNNEKFTSSTYFLEYATHKDN